MGGVDIDGGVETLPKSSPKRNNGVGPLKLLPRLKGTHQHKPGTSTSAGNHIG